MKKAHYIFWVLLMLLPLAHAYALQCSPVGETVVYVNGVHTIEKDAGIDRGDLERRFKGGTGRTDVTFVNGYNPVHLSGWGDNIESVSQGLNAPISDFDLNTILIKMHSQITTQKILLVGHSQGTFYTNSMYDYLVKSGVPKESIAVYNLATPASYIAGNGGYLTSGNDKVINSVREWDAMGNAPLAMSANILIPPEAGYDTDPHGGHYFGRVYLNGVSDRIVSDIARALGKLKAGASSATDGCFTPPPPTIAYKAQRALFAVADPGAQAIKSGASATGSAIAAAAQKAQAAAAYAAAQAQKAFSAILKTTPRVSTANQGAAAAAAVTSSPSANSPAKTASVTQSPQFNTKNVAPRDTLVKAPDPPADSQPPAPPPQPQTPPPQTLGPALFSVAPGFGGGGAPQQVAEAPAPIIPLTVQTPLDGALFATSSVALTGTTTPGYSVVASYASSTATAVADSNGDWSIALTLPEGTTAIGIAAADSEGNTSDAITRTITVDLPSLTAPALSISECAASLSASTCLIATTGATLSWNSVPDAAYYAYAVNGGIVATTTGTGATLSLTPNITSSVSVAAYDAAGNAATSTPIDTYVLTQPMIINEVAWAGTRALSNDEWIELKNISSYTLDLSRVAIASLDGSPYIHLSGTLASGGYYLVERREEATSIGGDLILAFDQLSDAGEALRLEWGHGNATTTLDRTPAVSVCSGWCSGTEIIYMTMERTQSGTDGTATASWQHGSSTIASVVDASGNTIQGTPRAENSTGGSFYFEAEL